MMALNSGFLQDSLTSSVAPSDSSVAAFSQAPGT
jgi:hypothetical protein